MTNRRYYLLTGATGLLGRYLLRNLLARDVPVAVVVRGTRIASVRARVESLLAEIEESLDRYLPRPVVLEGELTEEALALDGESLAWAKRHVGAILHNAASLTFQKGDRHEEPWLSNVTGTRNVLELARTLGVREFHHVSTAYVCGLRTGRILESELDVGQTFGNDYEASKLEAETMVRGAPWLDAPTVYRPAIIVGDSQTAFTNTFHGFYTPLAIAWSMFDRAPVEGFDARSLVEILGLSGSERKALVPVDWVAAAISHLLTAASARGGTFHLTPREATPVSLLCDVFDRAVRERAAASAGPRARSGNPAASSVGSGAGSAAVQAAFRKQMSVYQAYWRDDPRFDAANTERLAPHLPCPRLDEAALMRLSRFALDRNFWSSRGTESPLAFDAHQFLAGRAAVLPAGDEESGASLHVSGPGGGAWRLASSARASIHLSGQTLASLARSELDLATALGQGAVAIEADAHGARQAEQTLAAMLGS